MAKRSKRTRQSVEWKVIRLTASPRQICRNCERTGRRNRARDRSRAISDKAAAAAVPPDPKDLTTCRALPAATPDGSASSTPIGRGAIIRMPKEWIK
jgi:hypothetical protein